MILASLVWVGFCVVGWIYSLSAHQKSVLSRTLIRMIVFCCASCWFYIFFLLCCSPLYYSLENVRLYILVERYVVVYVDWKAGYYSLERSSIDVEANAIDVC